MDLASCLATLPVFGEGVVIPANNADLWWNGRFDKTANQQRKCAIVDPLCALSDIEAEILPRHFPTELFVAEQAWLQSMPGFKDWEVGTRELANTMVQWIDHCGPRLLDDPSLRLSEVIALSASFERLLRALRIGTEVAARHGRKLSPTGLFDIAQQADKEDATAVFCRTQFHWCVLVDAIAARQSRAIDAFNVEFGVIRDRLTRRYRLYREDAPDEWWNEFILQLLYGCNDELEERTTPPIATFHGAGSLAAFVSKSAANFLNRRWNQRPRHASIDQVETRSSDANEDAEPQEDIERCLGLLATAVQRALGEVDREDRLIYLLRYRDGLTQREVAQIIGRHSANVQRRITNRIQPRLQAVLSRSAGREFEGCVQLLFGARLVEELADRVGEILEEVSSGDAAS